MVAPSLLACGRVVTRKVLRLEARGLTGAVPSAAFCTRPGGSRTPQPNVVASQGTTKLLAIKAPAEFPKMLSSSSILVSANKGESISSSNLKEASEPSAEDMRMFMSRKTVVAFPQRAVLSSLEEENLTTPATEGGLGKESVEEETSSSSSSDSDSSSDSEEEHDDDDSEVSKKTKAGFPRQDSVFTENIAIKASMLAKENMSKKSHKEYVAKKPMQTKTDVSPIKQVPFSKTSISLEKPKPKARDPKVKSTPKEADRQKLVLEPHVTERPDLTDTTHKSDLLEEKSIGTQVAAIQLKVSSVTQKDKKQKLVSRGEEKKVKEAQEPEAGEAAAPKIEETSESTVLVVGTTAQEETIQEGVQTGERNTIEETTATAEPAPEEFDNSTYKNLQHHDYNIYTFVDSVVGLSKFRQPQPSSGRPSPRH